MNFLFQKEVDGTKVKENYLIIFSIIAFFVLVFNLIAILGYESIYLDDNLRRTFALNKEFPWYIAARSYFRPFFVYPMYKLLVYNVKWARAVQVIFYMIPLSWLFYYLLRKYFKFPIIVAISAAIVPNILPGQNFIPAFIDGSYPVNGLIFTLMALFIGIECLNSSGTKRMVLALFSFLVYWFSIEMYDHAILFIPSFTILFIFWKNSKIDFSKIFLILSFSAVAAQKAYTSIFKPIWVKSQVPVSLSMNEIGSRIKDYFLFAFPFQNIVNNHFHLMLTFLATLVILSFYYLYKGKVQLFKKIPELSYLPQNKVLIIIYTFFIFWTVCTIAPFFTSYFWSSRYSHLSAFGLNALFIVSIFVIFNIIFEKILKFKGYAACSFLLIALVITTGLLRYSSLKAWFDPQNYSYRLVKNVLKDVNLPKDSQIIFVGPSTILTGGYWHYSSGFLKFVTGRKDVNGMIGTERHFYNAFNPDEKTFNTTMTGLDPKLPIFLFRIDKAQQSVKRLKYALQWTETEKKLNKWKLLDFDLYSGKSTLVQEGMGKDAYLQSLDNLKIAQEEIMFGG